MARALRDTGHLDMGEGRSLTKRCRLPGGVRSRFYVVKPSIFDDAAD